MNNTKALKNSIAKKTALHNGWIKAGGRIAKRSSFSLPTGQTGYTFATQEQRQILETLKL